MDAFDYKLVPLPEFGLFWIVFSGRVSMGKLGAAHDVFTAHPEYVDGIDELLDFRATSVSDLTQKEIDMVRLFMREQPSRHNSRSAVLVGSQLEFGLMRMMGANLDVDVPMSRGVFYSVDEALAWLRPGEADDVKRAFQLTGGAV